jgi:hypothetical protein
MSSGEGGGTFGASRSKGHENQVNEVTVPDWLQPFVTQATGTATDALAGATALTNEDRVADLTPEQLEGLSLMQNMLGSDYFTTAQSTFMDAAQGMGQGFLSPELQNYFGSQDVSTADTINQYRDALGFTQNQTAQDALEGTARGDYLYGGEGFDRAVQASMNTALPQIASAFGGSVGGASGAGLSRAAVGEAAVDAFAGQYGQERRNQLGAAGTLDAGGRFDRSLYSGLAEGQKNRAMQGNQFLGSMTNAERNRQMAAAAGLPDIGMLDANTQMQIGEYLQNQQQREIDAPLQAQLQLLMAALQGPGSFSPFLGSTGRRDYRQTNIGMGGNASGTWG